MRLFQPTSMNMILLVHIRAFTYILSQVMAKWYLQC